VGRLAESTLDSSFVAGAVGIYADIHKIGISKLLQKLRASRLIKKEEL